MVVNITVINNQSIWMFCALLTWSQVQASEQSLGILINPSSLLSLSNQLKYCLYEKPLTKEKSW